MADLRSQFRECVLPHRIQEQSKIQSMFSRVESKDSPSACLKSFDAILGAFFDRS
jgi:hypothetical protein